MISNILDKYPELSIEAVGLLWLIFESKKNLIFETKEAFLKHFRIKNYYRSEQVWAELIEADLVNRKKLNNSFVYKIKYTARTITVPLKFSKEKLVERYIEEKLGQRQGAIRQRLERMLSSYKKNVEQYNDIFTIDVVEKFFELFDPCTPQMIDHVFQEFIRRNKKYSSLKSFQYSVARSNKAGLEEFKPESWDDSKQQQSDEDFALKLVTGDVLAKDTGKYQIMLKRGRVDELRRYYEVGKTLVHDPSQLYEYGWLNDVKKV